MVRKLTCPAPTSARSRTESQGYGETQNGLRQIGVVVVMIHSSMARFQRSPTAARKLSEAMPPNPGAAISMPQSSWSDLQYLLGEHRQKTLVGDDKHGEGVGGDNAAQNHRRVPNILKAFFELAHEIFFALY